MGRHTPRSGSLVWLSSLGGKLIIVVRREQRGSRITHHSCDAHMKPTLPAVLALLLAIVLPHPPARREGRPVVKSHSRSHHIVSSWTSHLSDHLRWVNSAGSDSACDASAMPTPTPCATQLIFYSLDNLGDAADIGSHSFNLQIPSVTERPPTTASYIMFLPPEPTTTTACRPFPVPSPVQDFPV